MAGENPPVQVGRNKKNFLLSGKTEGLAERVLQLHYLRFPSSATKKFMVDFLTKKQKVNEGEIPQYYVENSHPAIIPPEIHDLVQAD